MQYNLFPFPIFRPRGITLFCLPIVFPILGFTLNLADAVVLQALIWSYAALLLLLALSGLKAWLKVGALEIGYHGSSFALSGRSHEVIIRLSGRNARLRFKQTLPDELVSEQLIYEVLIKESAEVELKILPLARGSYSFKDFHLRIADSFWWWQFRCELESPYEFEVLPNHLSKAELNASSVLSINTSREIRHPQQGEREFDSLRRYHTGDDIKRVDWKRSAKQGKLVIKTFRPESHQRIAVAIDCGRRMRPRVAGRELLEYATDSAARVINLAAQAEDEVGLFAFHRKAVSVVPCRKGRAQQSLLKRHLQQLVAEDTEPNYHLLTNWICAQKKRTLLLLITNHSNPKQLEALRGALRKVAGKHLPIVFSVEDESMAKVAESSAQDLTQAYVISAAHEQLAAMKAEADVMSKSGLQCIYCKASELPEQVSARYQRLKSSGAL